MKKLVYYTLVVLIIINIVNITNNNEIIPNESIRMRVIPNSNNTEDVYIKNKVKEYLEKDVLNMISKTNNIDDVREIINNNLNNIDNNINIIFQTIIIKWITILTLDTTIFQQNNLKDIHMKKDIMNHLSYLLVKQKEIIGGALCFLIYA